ncbi:hypothetical protein CHARACLAT_011517 [Characodon lateralis]|uniref:Uncharacterized protein n=1 Tax=Characodon lateralis TaxID=208331 RepID=A0ABU7CME2_9TELE|nr:hypothetical protein [Characodon lateralis]
MNDESLAEVWSLKTSRLLSRSTIQGCRTGPQRGEQGLYCRPCFHSLGNMCICMRPLDFQEDGEEELDSSDDEQLNLWSVDPNSPWFADWTPRTLMRKRIFTSKSPQDHLGSPDFDSASFHSVPSGETFYHQEVELTEVSVHTPDDYGNQPASP